MKKLIVLLVVLALVVAGCGAGAHAIREGRLRDTIFSIEPRENGSTTIWFTHDDVGAYCTRDATLTAKAQAILLEDTPEVVVSYRSINNTDSEWTWIRGTGDGCASDKGATVYLLTGLWRLSELSELS